MTLKQLRMTSCASIAILSIAPAYCASAADGERGDGYQFVKIAPPSGPDVLPYVRYPNLEPSLTNSEKLALLQKKIKYVFVLFQENRSFDHYFGTYPGVNGLFSQSPAATPGFVQKLVDTNGTVGTISPFLITPTITDVNGAPVKIYPEDTDSVDHSHAGINNSMDLDANNNARNDRYALNEEKLTTLNGRIVSLSTGLPPTSNPTLAEKQKGELVMSHLDCDTVPFLWQYADRFTLFDNFHQTIIGPSTPNAIAMVAGQSGETQWVLHPSEASNVTTNPGGGEPVVGDSGPFPGSNLDTSKGPKPPYNPEDESPSTPALNQTYATLMLSFMGKDIKTTIKSDENPSADLADVQQDIATIAGNNLPPVPWGWYQDGYDSAPSDGNLPGTHSNYVVHHNGPQYFGYIGDNPKVAANLHGLSDFFTAISNKHLGSGGVFYVRGGYGNNDNLLPVDPAPVVQANFVGSDDHPGYTDTDISEALLADEINAIAESPYWSESAIIITYDETDGLYDHADPQIRAFDPEGNALSGGPRIPAIVISPYAVAHGISTEYSEHSSIIKFIDELFNLTPLADLPDEANARQQGLKMFGQSYLGPADDLVANMGDLTSAFDNARLQGTEAPLPASYAEIPRSTVLSLPHYGGRGCNKLRITPTDYVHGKPIDLPPADFNPRPSSTPGTPSSGTWTQ